MRLLLDECIPRQLAREFPGHSVQTVQQAGWSSLKNGRLLTLAQADFDVFVTVDQNLEYQQHIVGFDIAVLVLVSPSNNIDDLRPLMPRARTILSDLRPGLVVRVEREADA